jgi:hypothetical protein
MPRSPQIVLIIASDVLETWKDLARQQVVPVSPDETVTDLIELDVSKRPVLIMSITLALSACLIGQARDIAS